MGAIKPISFAASLLAFFSIFTMPLEASIYSDCAMAIEKQDVQLIQELAGTIRRLKQHPQQMIKAAEKCVSVAEGIEMRLDSFSGKFVDEDELLEFQTNTRKKFQAQVEAETRRKKNKLMRESAMKALDNLNEQLVSDGIYESCTDLFNRSETLAMTNQVCIQSFITHGHPELRLHSTEFDAILKELEE